MTVSEDLVSAVSAAASLSQTDRERVKASALTYLQKHTSCRLEDCQQARTSRNLLELKNILIH